MRQFYICTIFYVFLETLQKFQDSMLNEKIAAMLFSFWQLRMKKLTFLYTNNHP